MTRLSPSHLAARMARWSWNHSRILVQRGPGAMVGLYAIAAVWFLGLLGLWAWVLAQLDGPFVMVAAIIVGLMLGRVPLIRAGRALAYREGWLDGREAMVSALREATERGIEPADWLQAMWESDAAMLGIHPGHRLEDDADG